MTLPFLHPVHWTFSEPDDQAALEDFWSVLEETEARIAEMDRAMERGE